MRPLLMILLLPGAWPAAAPAAPPPAGHQAGAPLASAPQAADRGLARRQPETDDEDGVFLPGRFETAEEASGSYALGPDPDDQVEIILNGSGDQVRLQGYLTHMGEGSSDRGTPLTYFFVRTTVRPGELTFVTRQVHGAWWSFRGGVVRGDAPTSAERGYLLLVGTLTEHFADGRSLPRRVSLPLLPEARSRE